MMMGRVDKGLPGTICERISMLARLMMMLIDSRAAIYLALNPPGDMQHHLVATWAQGCQ